MTRTRFAAIAAAAAAAALSLPTPARAAAPLPYANRVRSYTGMGSTVLGGIHNVGMAGADVAVADGYDSAAYNPAGLAMTFGGADLSFTGNTLYDGNIQSFYDPIGVSTIGAALDNYPWGFSVGYSSPYREESIYLLPNGAAADLDITTRELQFSAAHVLANDRLALGVGLTLGQGERGIQYAQTGGTEVSYHSYMVGVNFGAMYQLPRRWILGMSFRTPMNYPGDSTATTPGVDHFFQPIDTPGRFILTAGWVPNRVFHAGFRIDALGATPAAALLRDTNEAIGSSVTFQPKLGASYLLAEYREFRAITYGGAYLETSRIWNAPVRPHLTLGAEARFWVLNFGWGIDVAPEYRNYLYSAGVNVVKLAERLGLLPHGYESPSAGLFPPALALSAEGLPKALSQGADHDSSLPNPAQVVRELPKRLGQIPENIGKQVKDAGEAIRDALGSEPDTPVDAPVPNAPPAPPAPPPAPKRARPPKSGGGFR